MSANRIEIPYNEAGKRCIEVLSNLAMKQLQRARDAAQAAIDDVLASAEKVDEKAMFNGKYSAVYATPCGERQKVVYDYRTKKVSIEAT